MAHASRVCVIVFALLATVLCGSMFGLPTKAAAATDTLASAAADASAQTSENRVVRVSCGINDALYLDDAGQPQGECLLFLQQVAWQENWTLEYVEGSWGESVANLADGTIDLLFPTQKIDDRMATMGFSEFIGGYQPIGLFASADAPVYLDDYAAFDGKRIAVSRDSSNADALAAFAAEHGFTYEEADLDSVSDKAAALADGTVDLVATSTFNTIPDAKIVAMLDYSAFYYCTRVDDVDLLAELDDGMMKVLKDNPAVATDVFGAALKGSNSVAFTRAETDVIKSTERLRIGMYDESLPLVGRDDTGAPTGIYVAICELLAEKTGIAVEPVLVPRSDSLYDYLDDGRVDFVICSENIEATTADPERYLMCEPIMDYVTVAATMPSFSFDDTPAPRFVLTRGRSYWETRIEQLYPEATITYVANTKECLSAVQEGRADVTLLNTWEYNYQTKNARFSDILEWENLRVASDLVLGALRTADTDLLNVVEKSVDMMTTQEKDALVATNLNMTYESYDATDRLYTMRGALLVGGVVLGVAAVVFGVYFMLRRRHLRELTAKNQQLEQANQAKTDFLARMSHELRTPLNAIAGYAADLRRRAAGADLPADAVDEDAEAIERAAGYQLVIIDDLLDIQSIEAGRVALVKDEVEMDSFMGDVVDLIAPEAARKGVAFSYVRRTRVAETYLFDSARLQRVLLIVLNNAVKFTSSGGTVTMTGQVLQESGHHLLCVEVEGTGVGMSRDFIDNQLFGRFSQEYQGNSTPYGGVGIGLAMAKDLVDLMGGTITCESEKEVGSTFTITVPVQPLASGSAPRKRRDPVPCDLQGVRVLLAEDNEMNQAIEKHCLECMGCEVDVAANGRIACEKFAASAEGAYDVVLMDIRMPEMDGLEATRTIRAMDRADATRVPILAVSANAFDSDVQASLDAGMDEHVAKPISPRVLHEKIKTRCAHVR